MCLGQRTHVQSEARMFTLSLSCVSCLPDWLNKALPFLGLFWWHWVPLEVQVGTKSTSHSWAGIGVVQCVLVKDVNDWRHNVCEVLSREEGEI